MAKTKSIETVKTGFSSEYAIKKRKQNMMFIKRHWQLYLLILLPLIYLFIFKYIPLWGSQIAFRNYTFVGGVTGSPWVGLDHIVRFIQSPQFERLIVNTLSLSIYGLIAGMLPPIVLAIALNYAKSKRFSKTVQLVTYLPYFISVVLIVNIVTQILSLNGIVNNFLAIIGLEKIHFMAEPAAFSTIYVLSGIWQTTGYSAVVYLAALSAVSPELHEAAIVDGANIWKRIYHVDVPHLIPTFVILTILSTGRLLNVGIDKVLLLQNQLNMQASDIISTYVYRIGIEGMQYSYSTAIGLFQSVVSLILLCAVNLVARKVGENSLW